MGIDDHVGGDPFTSEWHVLCMKKVLELGQCRNHGNQKIKPHLLPVRDSTGSFLSVTTGELVSNLRDPHRANLDLAEFVAILVDRHHYLVKGNNDTHYWLIIDDTPLTLGCAICGLHSAIQKLHRAGAQKKIGENERLKMPISFV